MAPNAAKQVEVGYYPTRGLAQPIRLALLLAGVPFEDKHYKVCIQDGQVLTNEWADAKSSLGMKFPNLPYLFDGETKIVQSLAILKYIGRKYKPELLGKSFEDQTEVDVLLGLLGDYGAAKSRAVYAIGVPEADKAANFEKIISTQVAAILDLLVQQLADKEFLVGDYPTLADLVAYELTLETSKQRPSLFQGPRASLLQFHQRVRALPGIQAFLDSDRCMRVFNTEGRAYWSGKFLESDPRH